MIITPSLILIIIFCHLCIILIVSYSSSRKGSNSSFFNAGKKSPWWLISWGIIGAVISGVTFISVPGAVGITNGTNEHFSYMQLILGNAVGYLIIAFLLLPTFYRMKLISIYGYLEKRFGQTAKKIGAICFMISRVFGSSIRLFLVALVLQQFVLAPFGVPFWLTAIIVPSVIWLYTFQGGTQTIIVTDSIQTALFIAAIIFTITDIGHYFQTGFYGMINLSWKSKYSSMFYFKTISGANSFYKQFFGGILIAIGTSGLDQDVMQKHLSCKNINDARKNIYSSTAALLVVNFLFLVLGASLYLMAGSKGIKTPERPDEMYPMMAFHFLSPLTGLTFIIGLIACSYSSADSALTALTTSFCVDFLHFDNKHKSDEDRKLKLQRIAVHAGFTVCFIVVILVMSMIGNGSIVNLLFKFTGYLYGPVIGLFAFGFFTIYQLNGRGIVISSVFAVVSTVLLDIFNPVMFHGFGLGLWTWIVNPATMFFCLWLFRDKSFDYRLNAEDFLYDR